MFSRILSQSTSRLVNRQMIRNSSNVASKKVSGHVGESWAVTEMKRVVPNILTWGSVLSVCLLWPKLIMTIKDPNYAIRQT